VSGEDRRSEARWTSEPLVYPITLAMVVLSVALQMYS
jgi:hypothetical protein